MGMVLTGGGRDMTTHQGTGGNSPSERAWTPSGAANPRHIATVHPLRIPRPSRKTTYVVRCTICGRVGVEQNYPSDAKVIAALHNEDQADTLGGVFASMLEDVRKGIRRCDRTVNGDPCGRVGTEMRWDTMRHYEHPFCPVHAAEWDVTPVGER